MKEGVEAQAKALGLKVKIVDAQNDPAKQANDISDLIESGVIRIDHQPCRLCSYLYFCRSKEMLKTFL